MTNRTLRRMVLMSDEWLKKDWKDMATGINLYKCLQKECELHNDDILIQQDLRKRMAVVNDCVEKIQRATNATSPAIIRGGMKPVPRVAFLPMPAYDDETGKTTTSAQ